MFKNSNEFSLYIEKETIKNKCEYLDTILKYCNDNFIDPEEVAKLVNKSLKEKIAAQKSIK